MVFFWCGKVWLNYFFILTFLLLLFSSSSPLAISINARYNIILFLISVPSSKLQFCPKIVGGQNSPTITITMNMFIYAMRPLISYLAYEKLLTVYVIISSICYTPFNWEVKVNFSIIDPLTVCYRSPHLKIMPLAILRNEH